MFTGNHTRQTRQKADSTVNSDGGSVVKQVQNLNQAYDEVNRNLSFGGSSVEDLNRNPNFENQALKQSLSNKRKAKRSQFKVVEPKEFRLSFDRESKPRPGASPLGKS
jgi:hypothetical protein